MAFVEIDHLTVKYGKLLAVNGIDLSIPRGEVYGFIGPNGAGKTSTMKVLATLMRPTGGTARLDGMDIPSHPAQVRRRIGYMPDFFGVYEDLSVNEYLHFFAAAFRIRGAQRTRVVGDVLELTDLAGKAEAQVDSLSRGMKQRLGIARVLLHDPDLLILDEPASGLDPRARIEIRELLKELRNLGKTILISSHILHELAHLCTHIGIIEAGRMIAQGSLQDIYAQLQLLRVIHVQIVNISDDMVARIKAIAGVDSLTLEADRVAIRVHETELTPEDMLPQLLALGARIRMYQPEVMDIETAFMKLTQGKVA